MERVILSSWVIMAGEIAIAIFSLVILSKIAKMSSKDKLQNNSVFIQDNKETQTPRLEAQINSLQDELGKTKVNYAQAQKELQDLKKQKLDLNDDLLKYKRSHIEGDMQLERLKKESTELKDKLAKKEQELGKMQSQSIDIEKELKIKNERLQVLEKDNKDVTAKSKDLEITIESLNKEKEVQNNIVAEYKKKDRDSLNLLKEETVERNRQSSLPREPRKEKIGEILLAGDFISKDILDKAVRYKEEFGGSITQYLLNYGHIDENQLAQCLCTQFAIPYLPLSSYRIPDEIIKLVPVDIAEKNWLIPVEKVGDLIMVVMADPLDTKAIKEVEKVTGCGVQPFVGILSEIIEALEGYYKVVIKDKQLRNKIIETEGYKGPERREAVRFNAKIDVYFPVRGYYKKSQTKNVSRLGFLLESDEAVPIGSILTLQINLPKDIIPLPIATVVQVMWVKSLENNEFEIGVKIIKISKQEIDAILEYASVYREE